MDISISQADKLGRRLGNAVAPVRLDDRRALQAFIAGHQPALEYVQAQAERITNQRPTGRLKTEKSTIEKLRRFRTRLSKMQDIAGVRLFTGDAEVQDHVVAAIAAGFNAASIDDKRERPSWGYRAVHVIVEVDGRRVEVQIRTVVQQAWADIFERLADAVGRDIRYGAVPTDRAALEIYQDMMESSDAKHRADSSYRKMMESYRYIEMQHPRMLRLHIPPKGTPERLERDRYLARGRAIIRRQGALVEKHRQEELRLAVRLLEFADEIERGMHTFKRGTQPGQ